MLNPSHCPKYWWRNLLNINNLWAEGEMCAAWTWYLADDFQFFLYSPIFLVVFTYSPPMSWVNLKFYGIRVFPLDNYFAAWNA